MKSVVAAAGVLCGTERTIFIQRRPPDTSYYPDYWEFPGGKVEAGESPRQALIRELKEEIGVTATMITPWLVCRHQYEHALVTLHVFRVQRWTGTPSGCESQQWRWQPIDGLPPTLLPANTRLWKWLSLPPCCIISAAEVIGFEQSLARLPQLINAPALLQLRDKKLPPHQRRRLGEAMAHYVKAAGGLLVVNDDAQLALQIGADGVHLSSARLRQSEQRPDFAWAGASCHNAQELEKAQQLQLDYAVFSPVKKTLTHVAEAPVGWEGFMRMASASSIPLYALGGLAKSDMETAIEHGAHGIAMMRQGW